MAETTETTQTSAEKKQKRVLIVMAHPDDGEVRGQSAGERRDAPARACPRIASCQELAGNGAGSLGHARGPCTSCSGEIGVVRCACVARTSVPGGPDRGRASRGWGAIALASPLLYR